MKMKTARIINAPAAAKTAFTIIELTLAMLFLSMLLISVALLTSRLTAMYQKGITMKNLNSTAGELVDEFNRAIANSPVINPSSSVLCGAGSSMCAKIYAQQTALVSNSSQAVSGQIVPTNGTFCSGKYSYIWNSGYALNTSTDTGTGDVKFEDSATHLAVVKNKNTNTTMTGFKILRFSDPNRELCESNVDETSLAASDTYIISSAVYNSAEELLDTSSGYNNFAIYDLKIYAPTYQAITNQAYFAGTFILATLAGEVDITGVGDYCSADYGETLSADFNYCAVNKFNFASRATGGSI